MDTFKMDLGENAETEAAQESPLVPHPPRRRRLLTRNRLIHRRRWSTPLVLPK